MKSKFKKRLTALISITTVGAVAPLVTACSNSNTKINHVHIDCYDSLYGVNSNTYKLLKKDYETKFKASLKNQGIQEGSTLWQSRMNDFNCSINNFDNISNSMYISYGDLTSSVMDYARKVDNLQLRRVTDTMWSDVDALFQGACNSFDLYMTHEHISETKKAKVLSDATIKFNALKAQLESEGYKENDPYGAVMRVRSQLMVFFDDINDSISKMSAIQIMSNFFTKYNLSYKADSLEARYDQIKNLLNVGKDMSSYFDTIFQLVEKETGNIVQFDTGTLLVPGYKITPTLESKSIDEKANKFTIKVSFSAVKTSIYNSGDQERINKATGYFLSGQCPSWRPETIEFADSWNVNAESDDQLLSYIDSLPKEQLEFEIYNSPDVEKANLTNFYFSSSADDTSSIQIKFPTKDDSFAKLDTIVDIVYSDTKTGYIGITDLAALGLQISDDNWATSHYLSDLILSSSKKSILQVSEPDNPAYQLTKIEELVLNCKLIGYIDATNSQYIKCKLSVYFNNSYNHDDKKSVYEYDQELTFPYYDISEHFFATLSKKYSNLKRSMELYRTCAPIKKVMNLSIAWMSIMTAINVSAGAFMAVFIYRLTIGHQRTPNEIGGLISCISAISFSTQVTIKLKKTIYDPTKEFHDRLENVVDADATQNIIKHLDNDKQYLCYYDENGNFNQKEFDEKIIYFLENPQFFVDLNKYYDTLYLEGHDGAVFQNLVIANRITKEDFDNNVTGLKPDKVKDLIGHSVSAGISWIGALVALVRSSQYNKKSNDAVKEQPAGQKQSEKLVDPDIHYDDPEANMLDKQIKAELTNQQKIDEIKDTMAKVDQKMFDAQQKVLNVGDCMDEQLARRTCRDWASTEPNVRYSGSFEFSFGQPRSREVSNLAKYCESSNAWNQIINDPKKYILSQPWKSTSRTLPLIPPSPSTFVQRYNAGIDLYNAWLTRGGEAGILRPNWPQYLLEEIKLT